MNLWSLAREYETTRVWVLPSETFTQCIIEAARFYLAYGEIASLNPASVPAPAPVNASIPSGFAGQDMGGITEATVLTTGEWAIIKPLFTLYVERESAMHLEASRGLGVDVYGRSVAEVQADITQTEMETLPAKSFVHDMIEV